jgi:DNA-binding NarL/FixJ family response regulator
MSTAALRSTRDDSLRGDSTRGDSLRDDSLRDDEVAVLALLAEGLPLETVARRLSVSERTLRRRTRAICDRLGVPSVITAVAWAARRGLL